MVSESDVTMAYRLLMGREPENQQVVRDHARNIRTLSELRAEFMSSTEFRESLAQPVLHPLDPGVKPLNWPAAKVEVDVSHETLERMIGRIEGEFLEMGATEPHWSVLTATGFWHGT